MPPSSIMPMRPADLSRREFLRRAGASGIAITVMPLAQARIGQDTGPGTDAAANGTAPVPGPADVPQAVARMQTGETPSPDGWYANGRVRFRRDGVLKVTGGKVFSIDVRARDMPDWPDEQSHALLLMATRTDRVFDGLDLSVLGKGFAPDVVVTAAELERDGLAMPEPDFYGTFFVKAGTAPTMLGQPVAILIWHDYTRFRLGRRRLRFNDDALSYGAPATSAAPVPFGGGRFVRIEGAKPDDPDVYSALTGTTVYPDIVDGRYRWPEPGTGNAAERAMKHATEIRDELRTPPESWHVIRRSYRTPYIDPAAMEADNGNAWFDRDSGTLHVVTATQAPYTVAAHIAEFARAGSVGVKALKFSPGYTVGYGQKEHHAFPYYAALAGLYGNGRPVRLALDRPQHFQLALKRHPFEIDVMLAVDRRDGTFRTLVADLSANGGGVKNFSPSVGTVAASALQSLYYVPKSDIAVETWSSRAPAAGSMRGYGTVQTMSSMEMLVDELAAELGIDAIELRRRNLLRSGMRNTQGAVPAGQMRGGELLDLAAQEPLWRERAARKAAYERANPGHRYGIGFAAVHKDYGTGAEAAIVAIEVSPEGRLSMRHVGSEIGCGSTTAQLIVARDVLGGPIDDVEFAVPEWPEMPLHTEDEPYSTPQQVQDERARDPHWVPRITSPRSASNSAYYFTHATRAAATQLFERGLWPAALSLWGAGPGGGQAAPLALRRQDAEWIDGRLTAGGLQPLTLAQIAGEAHRLGLVTGAAVHTFNRWAWAEAEFEYDGETFRAPIDALSLRRAPAAADAGGDAATAARAAAAQGEEAGRGYRFIPRRRAFYPETARSNAAVVYYAPCATMVELAVRPDGEVRLLSHKTWLECGTQIVPELVSGQIQGGIAMGIGHALYESLPLYEDGPGNGQWNFNRYRLPRASDVAVWSQSAVVLPPLSATDPPKGMAEVVMIPVIAAIGNAIHHASGTRVRAFPIRADSLKEIL